MSEKDKCCGECSSHESECGSHCGHGLACQKGFYFIRWIFGLIILAVVFCTGIAIGKFVGEINGGYGFQKGYGYSRMMQLGNDDYFYGPSMMRSWVLQTSDDTSAVSPKTKAK